MASRLPIHELQTRDKRGRWFVAISLLLSLAVLFATWLGLFTFMTANAAYGTFASLDERYLPDAEGKVLDLPDLSRVSRVYASDGTLLAEFHDGRVSEPVRFEEVPPTVLFAVLAAEDSDFFEHEGIDYTAILGAALDNLASQSTRGGSTITQQVVKNVFVGDEVTLRRKINEAVVAIELEQRYSKEQIIEFYMNSVYFGASAYGVQAAGHEFYGKDLDDLTIAEAATIAVLPRNPTTYDPRRFPETTLDRRNDVIDEMAESGFISEAVAESAQQDPLGVLPPSQFTSPADHVVAEVKRRLLNEPEFSFLGATKEERKQRIFGCPADDVECEGGGGLDIVLTIDLELQQNANDILEEWLPTPDDPDVQAPTGAIAMVDNATGAVRVMASGLPFEQEQFDLATQGVRNPGSAFKPFALVAYLESGGSMGSWWDSTSPKRIKCPYHCSDLGNIWRVRNAGGGSGLMRLFEATYNSVNVVFAQVAVETGPERIVDTAHRMGIESSLEAVPSIALGSQVVNPLEMASAFSNFATNGLWAEPYLVESITSQDGKIDYRHEVTQTQTVAPSIIAAVRRPLKIVPVSGTAPRANIRRPQGGKTGTHQSYKDAWFVGFVPQYTTAVWVGYPDAQIPLENVIINGTRYRRVFGGSVPAPIWKQFMLDVLDGVPVVDFPHDPSGVSAHFVTPRTSVPSVVGLELKDATEAILNAHLRPEVVEVDSLEPVGMVLSQDIEAGAQVSQGSTVVIEVSTGELPSAPLIDLGGMTVAQAIDALRIFENDTGVQIILQTTTKKTKNPTKDGIILSTSPAPGSTVAWGTTITASVGEYEADEEENGE